MFMRLRIAPPAMSPTMARKPRASRDLTDEQKARLRPLVERAVSLAGGQAKLAEEIDRKQSTISRFLSGHQGASYALVVSVCQYLGEDISTVLGPSVQSSGGVI